MSVQTVITSIIKGFEDLIVVTELLDLLPGSRFTVVGGPYAICCVELEKGKIACSRLNMLHIPFWCLKVIIFHFFFLRVEKHGKWHCHVFTHTRQTLEKKTSIRRSVNDFIKKNTSIFPERFVFRELFLFVSFSPQERVAQDSYWFCTVFLYSHISMWCLVFTNTEAAKTPLHHQAKEHTSAHRSNTE